MKIGDEVYVHGYVDEIRNDVIIIRNEGGYFGTVEDEVFYYEEDERGYGTMNEANRKDEPTWEQVKEYCNKRCLDIVDSALRTKWYKEEPHIVGKHADVIIIDEPQTERIRTPDYCDICNHKGCGNCTANNLDDYCVPSGYEPITKTKTQNSNKNSNVILVSDGVSEAVRCAMCSNPNKSDRGCDGACSYDEKLYKRIMDAIDESRVDTPQTDEFELFDREALILLIECQKERIAELLAKDEPQTDEVYFLELMGAVERGEISDAGANQAWYEYINHKEETETQTETQNSNLTFEKDECAKEYEELGLKELKELIEADRKTESQTEYERGYRQGKEDEINKHHVGR